MTRHRSARRLLMPVAVAAAALGLLAVGAVATGRIALVGTHGVSMNPVYYQGDLVVVAEAGSYQVGQIVAYRVPAKHIVVLHRIIGRDGTGFVLKGDNNQAIDETHPSATLIVGRAVLHVPHGGLWLTRLSNPAVVALIAFALTAGGGTVLHTRRRRRRAAMSQHATRTTGSIGPLAALAPALRTGAAVSAALSVALGALAWTTTPHTVERTPTSRQLSFSYTAAVAASPAYDATTVHSPDPVFRRLSNTVTMQLDYQGNPGTISVIAELSTPGGWHTTVPLADPTSFTTPRYESTVRLDLAAFDARAQAAAAVTGLPAGPVNITVTPTIHPTGEAAFTPTLSLNLTPLQLSLAGGQATLQVHDSTTGTHTTQIRRRYAPLLASVQPIPAPPDVPVIDVTAFATLATLAQRCGQLVLHWSRSGVDTFIVLDEGTTYRYRSGSSRDAESTIPVAAVTTTTASAPTADDIPA